MESDSYSINMLKSLKKEIKLSSDNHFNDLDYQMRQLRTHTEMSEVCGDNDEQRNLVIDLSEKFAEVRKLLREMTRTLTEKGIYYDL